MCRSRSYAPDASFFFGSSSSDNRRRRSSCGRGRREQGLRLHLAHGSGVATLCYNGGFVTRETVEPRPRSPKAWNLRHWQRSRMILSMCVYSICLGALQSGCCVRESRFVALQYRHQHLLGAAICGAPTYFAVKSAAAKVRCVANSVNSFPERTLRHGFRVRSSIVGKTLKIFSLPRKYYR